MALERAQLVKHLRDLQYIKLDGIRMRIIDAKGMVSHGSLMSRGSHVPACSPAGGAPGSC